DMPVVMFDGLNTNFEIPASSLLTLGTEEYEGRRLLNQLAVDAPDQQFAFRLGNVSYAGSSITTDEGLPTSLMLQSGRSASGMATRFGFSSEGYNQSFGGLDRISSSSAIGFLGLTENLAYVAVEQDLGTAGLDSFSFYGFSGQGSLEDSGFVTGIGTRLAAQWNQSRLEVSTNFALENGSFMGLSGTNGLWFDGTSSVGSTRLAARHQLRRDLQLSVQVELGLTGAGSNGGLISETGTAHFSGFELGLKKSGIFNAADGFGLWASQPMRLEQAPVSFRLPSGRTRDGHIVYSQYERDLAPQSRQIDLGATYEWHSADHGYSASIGVMQSFNAKHKGGAHVSSVAALLSKAF
ncbi:MAG: hypothetical protein ACR2O8_00570, partial [Rhizobiaceae bacterium]